MRNSVLPVMTVLMVIAGAVGLQLGESAIAQIDPLYFQGAAEPARDVTRDAQARTPNAYARAYGWSEGYQARAEDCGDCAALLVRQSYAPQTVEPLIAYSDATIAPRWEQADAELMDPPLVEAAAEPAHRRYLHYPVSADQAELSASFDRAEETPAAEEPIGL